MGTSPKSSLFRLSKLPFDTPIPLKTGPQDEWVQKLLGELNEDVSQEELAESKEELFVSFQGEMKKMKSSKYGDIVTIRGDLEAEFLTYCVSSGDLMKDELRFPIMAAMIEESVGQKLQFEEDMTEIEIDGDELDLHYYQNGEFDLFPIFHEYIYLNKNPYPRLHLTVDADEEE